MASDIDHTSSITKEHIGRNQGQFHRRRRNRSNTPWYFQIALPNEYDIELLRPPKPDRHGGNKGFETQEECDRRDRLHIRILGRGKKRSRQLAKKLEGCSPKAPCRSSACKKCMREFRRGQVGIVFGHARRLQKQRLIPVLITLVWTSPNLRTKSLRDVSLDKLQARLRMTIRSVHLQSFKMIGGVEVDWNQAAGVWEPHAHLVAFVNDISEVDVLRPRFKKGNGVERPMVAEKVKSLRRAVPYLWKFAPMRRVQFTANGRTRSRKMQLSHSQLREALRWLDGYQPTDFVFLQGLMRRGATLVEV